VGMNDLSANNFRLLLAGMLLWFDAPDDPLPSQVCAPRAACKPDRRHQANPHGHSPPYSVGRWRRKGNGWKRNTTCESGATSTLLSMLPWRTC
jgi:hypothetical protein